MQRHSKAYRYKHAFPESNMSYRLPKKSEYIFGMYCTNSGKYYYSSQVVRGVVLLLISLGQRASCEFTGRCWLI